MTPIGLGRFSLYFFGVWAVGLAVAVALPHDKFLRYQALNDGRAPTAYWVYERIHKDPAPIDIAFIGSSRIGLAVHSQRLEEDLKQKGVVVRAANLHVVKNGIDMQYVIAKELLETRKVKLLVLEMIDWEDRRSHPDFIYLADVNDVLSAPLFVNLDYFSDLVRLPGRQLDLFLQSEEQASAWRTPSRCPPYQGSNLDHAQFVTTLDGVRHYRNDSHTKAELEGLREAQERLITPPVLTAAMNGLEFRLPRFYTERILELARLHGTTLIFLYIPRYGGPREPVPYGRYARQAPLINPWPTVQDDSLWSDATHVNWAGAQRITDFVADSLADRKELH